MATQKRGNWSNQLEFIFSIIGCLVGLGNVWRFPYVCFTNGGAAFLIPYLLAMCVCGMPLLFLEFVYCQYSNLGPGRAWILCPLFRGIGYGMVVLVSLVAMYYSVIISWALYYMAMSFTAELPWSTCDNSWNTPSCISIVTRITDNSSQLKGYFNEINMTNHVLSSTVSSPTSEFVVESSVIQFWKYHVLQLTENIECLGKVRWQLLLCLMAVWVIVFFCLFKDIKTSGKVVYVAAVLPYVILTALLVRGALLPGASNGVRFYVVPQWQKLLDWKVWMAASSQVFYSVGIGAGGVSTLASFNPFHYNCYRDAMILPIVDGLTSVFAGFVIFVYLGYMAHVQGSDVDKVATEGAGLAFIAYPEALATMPLPQLWSVLFFLVLVTVGLDSQFVHVQTITSALVDAFPRQLALRKRWITLAVCFTCFLLGIPFVTQGGVHVLELFDFYVSSVPLVLIAFMECVVLSWVYGTGRLYEDITMMIGYRPCPLWHIVWRVLAPGFVLVTWILGLVDLKNPNGLPGWAIGMGWVIGILPLMSIPVMAIITLLSQNGSFIRRLQASVQPTSEWRPAFRKGESGSDEMDYLSTEAESWKI